MNKRLGRTLQVNENICESLLSVIAVARRLKRLPGRLQGHIRRDASRDDERDGDDLPLESKRGRVAACD